MYHDDCVHVYVQARAIQSKIGALLKVKCGFNIALNQALSLMQKFLFIFVSLDCFKIICGRLNQQNKLIEDNDRH